jgi:glutaredoxin-related protein
MANHPCMSSNEKFTVIGADWCGYTKKILKELEEHDITNFDYLECSSDDKHEACLFVQGYPAVVDGPKEGAAAKCKAGEAVPGYRSPNDHPIISKKKKGGKKKGKKPDGKQQPADHYYGGGGGKFTVVGADWCGFTTKLVKELEEAQVEFEYVACDKYKEANGTDHVLCEGVLGFPVAHCGVGEEALKSKRNELKTHVGYANVAEHPIANGSKC